MEFREIRDNEIELLQDFLYEAIFIPEGVEPPDREIIEQPELKLYYEVLRFKKLIMLFGCMRRSDSGLWMRMTKNLLWCVNYKRE